MLKYTKKSQIFLISWATIFELELSKAGKEVK